MRTEFDAKQHLGEYNAFLKSRGWKDNDYTYWRYNHQDYTAYRIAHTLNIPESNAGRYNRIDRDVLPPAVSALFRLLNTLDKYDINGMDYL